jgi:23S rRNA (adenine2503-C2)-methyltransferase
MTKWKKIEKITGQNPNVCKYVFTQKDAIAEAVLYKYPTYAERTVICCSTQSGCPIGCRFCGSGDYFVRNLTTSEILEQVFHLIEETGIHSLGIKKLQIMFMSMGEPMLNMNNLIQALRVLYLVYPKAALLVSTIVPSVLYADFLDISENIPTIGLQFSIHESTDEKRNELIPFAMKWPLWRIAEFGNDWNYATGRTPFINYCAHEHNTTESDADRLLKLFDPKIFQATISVVCEREETVAASNSRQKQLATDFMQKLNQRGFSTRCFDPAGQDDIGGGCGQLWYVQDWMKKNPELARPSIGHGLVKIHTPN